MMNAMIILKALIGGASAMFLAMGVGRFAFTPILPIMQSEFAFSDTISGALASANYLGYLIGAVYARHISGTKKAYPFFITSIFMSIVMVSAMYVESVPLWYLLRFLSGFFSALVFVQGSEFVIELLIKQGRPQMTGMIFSGVGAGMAASGLTIPLLSTYFNSSQIWLTLGMLCIIPALIALKTIPKGEVREHQSIEENSGVNKKKLYALYGAYFLEGMGYIVTGTFISVIVLRGTGSVMLSGYVWVIAGLGAVFITPLWGMLAKRIGNANALITAYLVQSAAIALPVLFNNLPMAMLGAVGFGGTFLGIVTLAFAYGREISPSGKTTAVLTIYFSLGQMAGPLFAGRLADISGGFYLPVMTASVSVFIGAIIIILIKGVKNAIHQH
jgi:MFS family permease